MADERPNVPLVHEARLVLPDVQTSLNYIVNTNVTDMTERAAKAMVDVAEATHVKPKRVVMRGTIAGTIVIGALVCIVLSMTWAWSLHPAVAVAAIVAIAGPFGLVAAKVLPKVFEHSVGSGA
jgi:hypothetical protein